MYRFYSKPTTEGVRVAIAGKFTQTNDNGSGRLDMAASRCSSKDSFFRKKGRQIAEGRLDKGKLLFSLKVSEAPTGNQFINIASRLSQVVESEPSLVHRQLSILPAATPETVEDPHLFI